MKEFIFILCRSTRQNLYSLFSTGFLFIYLFFCNFHGGSDVRGDTGGFVVSEGGVFGDVGVKIDQGISASLGCQTVAVNDIWQR